MKTRQLDERQRMTVREIRVKLEEISVLSKMLTEAGFDVRLTLNPPQVKIWGEIEVSDG